MKRTAEDQLQRMEALVRRLAGATDIRAATEEARAIVAEIDGPQSDEDWANSIMPKEFTSHSWEAVRDWVLAGIAKGRELALAEQKQRLEESLIPKSGSVIAKDNHSRFIAEPFVGNRTYDSDGNLCHE